MPPNLVMSLPAQDAASCALGKLDSGIQAALYARVSSDRQAQAGTIDSQIAAIGERVRLDGVKIGSSGCFVDDGFSGSTLLRPALERLRDVAAAGEIDRLYVLCPDRLARSFVHQMLLVEELERCGVELVFINRELAKTPEDQMLLQMQGVIAEYERAKIMERCRRGRLHAARNGNLNALSNAPYGYARLARTAEARAQFSINPAQAQVVRRIFQWVGVERVSLRQVCRRLENQGILSPGGNARWDRTTVWDILGNPAYKGEAAFGRSRAGPPVPRPRPARNSRGRSRDGKSRYRVAPQEWTRIPVPAIVEAELFEAAALQLEENRRRSRAQGAGPRYLLQGLLVCACCQYACCGHGYSSRRAADGSPRKGKYVYYRCAGSDGWRHGGALCDNRPARQDLLDDAVWNDVRALLADPRRVEREMQRRLNAPSPNQEEHNKIERRIQHTGRVIARLIDAFGEGVIKAGEFEPRLLAARQTLSQLQGELRSRLDLDARQRELRVVVDNLAAFGERVKDGLEKADWATRRELIRMLVKRVEMDKEQVKIVYRVDISPFDQSGGILQHCWERPSVATGGAKRNPWKPNKWRARPGRGGGRLNMA